MMGPATAAAAAAREGGEETPAGGTARVSTRIAISAQAADAETLCPAAVIVARAVEAVLSGSTTAFGGDSRSATASEAATPAPEGLRVVGVGGKQADDVLVDGGEGGQEATDRYREVLEGLGRAHVALDKAIESAEDSFYAPAVIVDDTAAATVKGHEEATALPVDARVLPPVSQWQFRCSSDGAVQAEAEKQEENEEENEGLQQVRVEPRLRTVSWGWCTMSCGHSTLRESFQACTESDQRRACL